jgi:hypothetical protein
MGEGGRKENRKRFVLREQWETQSVFPSPAESKGFALLGEWLNSFQFVVSLLTGDSPKFSEASVLFLAVW